MTEEYRSIEIPIVRQPGVITASARAITIGEPIEPVVPDTTDPVIDNFNPPLGTTIARTDYIQFDTTDDSGVISLVFVSVRYTDGVSECIYDGENFHPRYLAGSSKAAITDGFRFTIRRSGGWLSTPIIMGITAVDDEGNVTTGEFV